MAKPKLALIPAAQGDKFYSVLPSSGVGDFDFTRSGGATRINSQGLIETVADGVSRLNYPLIDGKVVGCPSHLLEPQRTNLVPYSENFTDSSWFFDDATLISNSVISPDGTQNASTLIGNTVNSRHHIASSVGNAFVDGSYTVFAKAKELRYLQIASVNGTEQFANFDIKNGVIGLVGTAFSDAKIEDYGNGWYRCSVVSINEYNAFYLSLVSGLNVTWLESWVMSNNTDGLYIWGAQLEQGSYATSYIPSLIGSQTTRSAETANNSGDASTFNDSEGVLMAEINFLENGRIGISNADNSDQVLFGNSDGLFYRITENNSNPITQYVDGNVDDVNKIALKYKSTETSIFVNGFELVTNITPYSLSGLNELAFTAQGSPFYGNTKQIQYYDSADIDLETLTSWVSFSDMAEGQLYTIE